MPVITVTNISFPNSDNVYEVEYDPEAHYVESAYVENNGRSEIDLDGLYIEYNDCIRGLREILANAANEQYDRDEYAELRESDRAEYRAG